MPNMIGKLVSRLGAAVGALRPQVPPAPAGRPSAISALAGLSPEMMWAILGLIAATVAILAWAGYLWPRRGARLPPGSLGFPIVGELFTVRRLAAQSSNPMQAYIAHKVATCGEVFKGSLPPVGPVISFVGPEACRFVVENENTGFVADWPESTKELLGPYSLSTVTGDVHNHLRSNVAEAFEPDNLATYLEPMNSIVGNYVKSLSGQVFVYQEMKTVTFKVAADIILGASNADQQLVDELEQLFVTWFGGLFKPGSGHAKALEARESIVAKLKGNLAKRRSGKLPDKPDVVSILLQSSSILQGEEGMTDDEIVDVCINLLFSGHETVTCALTWIIRLLSEHPAVLSKLREEHLSILSEKATPMKKRTPKKAAPAPTNLTWDDYGPMEYTRKVIKEALRHTPPVCGGFRRATKDMEYNGFLIPSGHAVQYFSSYMHCGTDQYFPEPVKFDPERFTVDPEPDHYMPFGGGDRMCIASLFAMMEMKTILHHLLTKFTWTLSRGATDEQLFSPLPLPMDGLPIDLKELKAEA